MTKLKWIAGSAVAAGLILLDSLVLEQYLFKVKKFNIGEIDSGNKKLKAILLTDLHLRNKLDPKYLRLLRRIRQLEPDIILFAGDAIDEDGDVNTLDKFFSQLPAEVPKVAILGNHEYKNKESISSIRKTYQKHAIDLLVNESKPYTIGGKRLMITGLNDFIEGKQNFNKAIEGVGKEDMHIALVHSPLQQEELVTQLDRLNGSRAEDEKLNISYIFAGHNHGGQVTFLGLFPIFLPVKSGNYFKGWYNKTKPFLFVSKGFGNSTVPFRLGARAEMAVFNYFYR